MTARNSLTLVDSTGINHIQELTTAETSGLATKYSQYVYSLYTSTTLTVVGSGGNLTGQPMLDSRYQAGAYTTRVDRFATEAETQNISVVNVNYSRIQQTVYSGGIPADTNNLRWPVYLDGAYNLRAMTSTDFYDTFVAPALTVIQASTPGDYFISTSTNVGGATLVSTTPVYTDTRANTAAYTAGGIPEAQDQPLTINNYYLHKYNVTGVVDDGDLPLYVDANDEQIKQHSLSSWAATLGPWLQYYMAQAGTTTTYNINGSGQTMGTAMVNTILQPTGTGYTQRYVNTNDYRTQEFPNGTPIVANTYELKKEIV